MDHPCLLPHPYQLTTKIAVPEKNSMISESKSSSFDKSDKHTTMSFKRLRVLEKKEQSLDKLLNVLEVRRFQWTQPSSRRVLIIGLCFAPSLSFASFARVLTMTLGAFLNEAIVKVATKCITSALPDRAHVRKLLLVTAAEVLIVVRKNSLETKACFACDASNKRGTRRMIKHISFFEKKGEKVVTYELDSDACVGSNRKPLKPLTLA